jgi:UDP:flavonoid glycosyltransferase YjiC (YdhE family)
LANNVHVEHYVPQSLLLPHCSAVICHGGAGTTLSSLALGLPLLILPQGRISTSSATSSSRLVQVSS